MSAVLDVEIAVLHAPVIKVIHEVGKRVVRVLKIAYEKRSNGLLTGHMAFRFKPLSTVLLGGVI
jgi:hypothetical protein